MATTPEKLSPAQIHQAADRLPRTQLAHLPTALEPLPRLSRELGGPAIYIKRDDCTGLAMGGNKTRHSEFLLGDALDQQADLLVWGAGVQSNNCRQTAAACAKLGLGCHLLLSRGKSAGEVQGNLLLDHLFGATYEIVDAEIGPELDNMIVAKADQYRSRGLKVYSWDRKRVKALAAVSYAVCMAELGDQLTAMSIDPAALYVCSAGSTGAGLALGKRTLGLQLPVRNILPLHWPWDEQQDLARIANEAAELMQIDAEVMPEEIDITADYVGPGYGIPSAAGMEALSLMARCEGILLDPTYTGKALAALIADVRAGRFSADDTIVFLHTGGTPALFAYRDALVEMVPAGS